MKNKNLKITLMWTGENDIKNLPSYFVCDKNKSIARKYEYKLMTSPSSEFEV